MWFNAAAPAVFMTGNVSLPSVVFFKLLQFKFSFCLNWGWLFRFLPDILGYTKNISLLDALEDSVFTLLYLFAP